MSRGRGRRLGRYDHVNGFGQRERFPTPQRETDEDQRYLIEAGTPCDIRPAGTKDWHAYTTQRRIVCVGFLWRNRDHYGFRYKRWEIKVEIGMFSG